MFGIEKTSLLLPVYKETVTGNCQAAKDYKGQGFSTDVVFPSSEISNPYYDATNLLATCDSLARDTLLHSSYHRDTLFGD